MALRAFPPVRALDVLLVVALTVGSVLLLGWLGRDVGVTRWYVAGTLIVQGVIVLAAVHVVVVRGRGIGWWRLGMRPVSARWYGGAVMVAAIAVPAVAAVNLLVQWLVGTPFENPQIAILAPDGFSWPMLAAMLVAAGIVAPVAEEVVFRGLLYSWLRRYLGISAAVVVSALLFSLAHGITVLVPALVVSGVLLALLFEHSRSLLPPIIAHGFFNAIMVIVLYAALAGGLVPG